MNNMLSLEEHNQFYKELHKKSIFTGFSLLKYIPEIGCLIKNSNIESVLDFGCGKAQCWFSFNLKRQFGIQRLGLYDPGVDEFSSFPSIQYDMVICTDVLEHIPEHLISEVLDQIYSKATKIVFLSISTKLASKKIPNGENAHATVRPKEWWLDRLKKYNTLTITLFE